jgi:hypothetical protein
MLTFLGGISAPSSSTLKTEAIHSCKTLADLQWTIQHYIPKMELFNGLLNRPHTAMEKMPLFMYYVKET